MAGISKLPIDQCAGINGVICGEARKKVITLQNKLHEQTGRRPSIIEVINKMCREYPNK